MNVTGNVECWTTAVADGVALLDKENEGWWNHIDLDLLDMGSWVGCVLGQLYGSYEKGREILGIPYSEGDIYGFDAYQARMFGVLDGIWTEIIKARKATSVKA